jgi:hypothetical protein
LNPDTNPLRVTNQQPAANGPSKREVATRRVQKWYVDAGNAAQDLRNQIQARYQGFTAALDAAGADAEISALQAQVDGTRINPVPDENILYRDLILQLVNDAGMQVDGSAWRERNLGEYYGSWDWGNPFGLDGHDAAGELNKLGDADPATKKPFRSHVRP